MRRFDIPGMRYKLWLFHLHTLLRYVQKCSNNSRVFCSFIEFRSSFGILEWRICDGVSFLLIVSFRMLAWLSEHFLCVSHRISYLPVYVLCWIQLCCYITGPSLQLDVQGGCDSLSFFWFVPMMQYIFGLQMYIVSCKMQYMTYRIRMDKSRDIYCCNVDVYPQSENNLMSLSGQNDCVSCFGINSSFVIRISGSD